ncbi:hypothetical protein D4Q71_08290 [Rhodopseudomonas palustris]|nr:hypothetical protein D4Q71_08290 [Rhodopseudomonas palustris]
MTRRGRSWDPCETLVMAGLVPAIHVFSLASLKDVDARDKRGHDGELGRRAQNCVRSRVAIRCTGPRSRLKAGLATNW